ncbi:MAG TPA: class I SAM-dependent methyltransferase [Candidatus Paceibacterota bacterium]|nr:class I SAM-dependent methyltransferase [Candidatus Paceibacterota bacterium]
MAVPKSWDNRWEEVYKVREWGKYPPEDLIRFVARNYYGVPHRASVKILDLGCGTGAATWYIAREGFAAYGVDGSAAGIARAKKRFAEEGLRGRFSVGDIVRLDFTDGYFDAVTDIASIQHNAFSNIGRIIAEIHRVLKKGGRFFGILIAEDTDWVGWEGKTHFFTRAEIRTLFKSFHKLEIEEIRKSKDGGRKRMRQFIVQAVK